MRGSKPSMPHETALVQDTPFSFLELLNLILRVCDLHHVELRMLVIILDDADPADTLQQAKPYRQRVTGQRNASLQPFFGMDSAEQG